MCPLKDGLYSEHIVQLFRGDHTGNRGQPRGTASLLFPNDSVPSPATRIRERLAKFANLLHWGDNCPPAPPDTGLAIARTPHNTSDSSPTGLESLALLLR